MPMRLLDAYNARGPVVKMAGTQHPAQQQTVEALQIRNVLRLVGMLILTLSQPPQAEGEERPAAKYWGH